MRVARRLGLSVGTLRDWHAGKVPRHSRHLRPGQAVQPPCPSCGHDQHRYAELSRTYVYLLGLYLGDGTISKAPRGVYTLRVALDVKYPGIGRECAAAMRETMPANQVGQLRKADVARMDEVIGPKA